VYRSTQHPHERARALTVDVPHGEIMDAEYAAAIVAVRTGMPLTEVTIVTISAPPSQKAGNRDNGRLTAVILAPRTHVTMEPPHHAISHTGVSARRPHDVGAGPVQFRQSQSGRWG
jgi:hypothetical protein